MKCEKCQHESPPGTKFCSNCGTQLIPLKEEKPFSATETLQTPVMELSIGSTFVKMCQIIEELESDTFEFRHEKVESNKMYTYALVAMDKKKRQCKPVYTQIK